MRHAVERAALLEMPGRRETSWLIGGGEMGKVVRTMDWAKTPLGALENWPQRPCTTVSLWLASNFPISLAWGPNHIPLYNYGYWSFCGCRNSPPHMQRSNRTCGVP